MRGLTAFLLGQRRPQQTASSLRQQRTTSRGRFLFTVVGLALVVCMILIQQQESVPNHQGSLMGIEIVTNSSETYTITSTVERRPKQQTTGQVQVAERPRQQQQQQKHPQESLFFDGRFYKPAKNYVNNQQQSQQQQQQQQQDSKSYPPLSKGQCAEHAGYIIANMNGRLANNLFQIAMANHLAGHLCWKIIFKENWQGVFPNDARAKECFPDAMKPFQKAPPLTPTTNPSETDAQLFRKLNIQNSTRQYWNSPDKFLSQIHDGRTHKKMYELWWEASVKEGTSRTIGSRWDYDYHRYWVEDLVASLRAPPNATMDKLRTIHLNAYFIQYDWMKGIMKQLREWLQMNEQQCCRIVPSPNTVVMHVRNFQQWEQLNPKYDDNVYMELLDRLYFNNKDTNKSHELMIVCQPQDASIELIQKLQKRYNAKVVVGEDSYDAFCALRRAHHLVVSTHSTFSQMAALLSPHATYFDSPQDTNQAGSEKQEVHYLIPYRSGPEVTLVIPEWNYHLVKKDKTAIEEFFVPTSKMSSVMS